MGPDRQGHLSDIGSKAPDVLANLTPELPDVLDDLSPELPELGPELPELGPEAPELGRRGDGRKPLLEPIHARPEQRSEARRQKRDKARDDDLAQSHGVIVKCDRGSRVTQATTGPSRRSTASARHSLPCPRSDVGQLAAAQDR